MPVSRAIAPENESNPGSNVWGVLCSAALRGVDLAVEVLGLRGTANAVERAELFVAFGIAPPPASRATRFGAAVDWAKLSEFERGRVAREIAGAAQLHDES